MIFVGSCALPLMSDAKAHSPNWNHRGQDQDGSGDVPKPVEFSGNPFLSSVDGYPNWSAFQGIEWEEGQPRVQIDDEWYQLITFHGIEVEAILEFCEVNDWPAQRRFTEDLVQIVRLMGYEIDRTTDLVVESDDGNAIEMTDVAMTVENQRALLGRRVEELVVPQGNPFFSGVPGYPSWSAFTDIRWVDDQPMVKFEGEWFELIRFHEVAVEDILQFLSEGGWPVRMRFTEDLVQVVRLMGHPIERRTNLVLRDESGALHSKMDVLMTEDNLRRLVGAGMVSVTLSSDALALDLDEFRTALESQFAYLYANDVDVERAIQAIADKSDDGMRSEEFANELLQVIAMFIDGHASVSGGTRSFRDGYLPFLIEPTDDRYVAILPDRTGFVHDDYPYVVSLDGIDMSLWLDATSRYIRKGPEQSMRRRGIRMLQSIEQFRSELQLDVDQPLEVGLANATGDRITISMDIVQWRLESPAWPARLPPTILEHNIGYFYLGSMSDSAVDQICDGMTLFRDTDALIVDVRGNGGGIRTPLLELAGYLMTSDDAPVIGNIAKYRLAPQFEEDHLSAARYVYRIDSEQFDQRERDTIESFLPTFNPEWEPPQGDFSQWHFLVLSKREDDPRFDYRNPVVILMDDGCFSATDIFLGAMRELPNVTLMGQASGGGSARSQSFQLTQSGISIRCASMASFLPDGKLYDNHGVQPDVHIVRPPEFFLMDGEDIVLNQAIEFLSRQ